MFCTYFCISNWHTLHCGFCVYIYTISVVIIQCGDNINHVSPWGDQYRRSVGFTFAIIKVPGFTIGLFSHSKYCAMCNWSNNWWWIHDEKSMFRVIFACGITWSHSFRVQLVSDLYRPNTKLSLNVYIYWYMLFSLIRPVGTSYNMKPMPMVFIFSVDRDSFSNIWNFDWYPCLVIKLDNATKYYIISVPSLVFH